MKIDLISILTQEYGFKNPKIFDAPRQMVAETFFIETSSGQKYFCKLVNKPLFIPKILKSLPILDEIYTLGFQRINYPIKTQSGDFSVMKEGNLIVVFNNIEAKQSYEFDEESFGKLLGSIHSISGKINKPIPEEDFQLKHQETFEIQFEQTLTEETNDLVIQEFKIFLRKYAKTIRDHYSVLLRLITECKRNNISKVITHGDAGGNVLVKSATDLYIIDWDEILLAPPERDLWIHDHKPEFMKGYYQVCPRYIKNELARNYCICNQHFDYMKYYFSEILSKKEISYRISTIKDFEEYFNGWIKPYLEKII